MTTLPQSQSRGRRKRLSIATLIAGLLLVALIATFVVRNVTSGSGDPLADATTATASVSDLTLGVSATGQVEPRVQAELAFATSVGRVAEVLVVAGDIVRTGDALIQLDNRQTTAARDAAVASLAIAQADLLAVREGATPAQIAEAEAQIRAAQGNLIQTQGRTTTADIVAAQAAVEESRANLAKIEAGPRNDERVRAVAALDQARADLDRQRSALSSAKEQARLNVEARANVVRNAQTTFSTAYWDLEHVREKESDPRTLRPLTTAQEQDFQNTFERARLALVDAEAALAQAQKEYATAQQNELSGLQSAEARVATTQADLDRLLAGAEADALAAARARLARAQADLASLTGAESSGAVDTQVANLEAAEARLAQLTADPRASSLARAEAAVTLAQSQLTQAQIQLDDTTLRAPFDGMIATVNVSPGENISTQTPVVLIDVSRYLIKVTVDEVDIARVSPGQSVDVLIDALGTTLPGRVLRLEPLPQGDSAVTAYRVTVEIDPNDSMLRPGMTASATIIADRREGAVSVPVAAVRTRDGQSFVELVTTGSDGNRLIEERAVTVGLRTGEQVEIVSGLAAGDEVVVR